MSDNKDIRKKLEGQYKAYHEHVVKRDKYPLPQDKEKAEKTMRNVAKEIAALNAKLPKPEACQICKKFHTAG